MFSSRDIKKDFPIFKHHRNLIYLDSAATSLKPHYVITKIIEYYQEYSANVARGLYEISERATKEYEETREVVAKFINAKNTEEVIFTRSTTESVNLIAYALGREIVKSGDEIVISVMEHHSNFVPWQQLAFEVGADFKVIDVTDNGYLAISDGKTPGVGAFLTPGVEEERRGLGSVITKRTKILSLTYVSNVLGTINPIKEIDAAQAVPHMKVDVQALGCDFLAFSSHKMLGPTGVGVLWGRREILDKMFPFNYGGEMIEEVTIEKTTFNVLPHKFEAGTPNIDGVIALKEAIYYLEKLGLDKVREHEKTLTSYALKRLHETFGEKIRILGPKNNNDKGGVIAFVLEKCHPHDIAQILDSNRIAIRAGHHCAMPLHQRLGIGSSSRASFYIYNDEEDVEKFIEGLKKVKKILS